eukprot:COSAG05_NODE_15979_length_356_cov_1.396887_1_plen_75_part_10
MRWVVGCAVVQAVYGIDTTLDPTATGVVAVFGGSTLRGRFYDANGHVRQNPLFPYCYGLQLCRDQRVSKCRKSSH